MPNFEDFLFGQKQELKCLCFNLYLYLFSFNYHVGGKEIDESKHEIQEELSDQPKDSFNYQSSGTGKCCLLVITTVSPILFAIRYIYGAISVI